jgi:hypothetical protein
MGNEALLMIVTFAVCAAGCAAGALLSFLFGKKRKKAIGEKIEEETAACDYLANFLRRMKALESAPIGTDVKEMKKMVGEPSTISAVGAKNVVSWRYKYRPDRIGGVVGRKAEYSACLEAVVDDVMKTAAPPRFSSNFFTESPSPSAVDPKMPGLKDFVADRVWAYREDEKRSGRRKN